jgi:hypothetical protein
MRKITLSLLILAAALAPMAHADDPVNGACVFKNPNAYPYVTNVQTDDTYTTIELACKAVLKCINNPFCPRADAPEFRQDWVLDSWYETERQ